MLTTTLTDAAALAEIVDTQQLLLTMSDPDLTALGLLAAERYRLSLRNAALPRDLPALWVRFAQRRRAEQLAPQHHQRRPADTGDERGRRGAGDAEQPDRAVQLARSITNDVGQAQALTGIVAALVVAGQPDRAEQLARSITNDDRQAQALTEVAAALVAAGQPERARTATPGETLKLTLSAC
jgi:hypothetical protein